MNSYRVMIACRDHCQNFEPPRATGYSVQDDPIEAIKLANMSRDELHETWIEILDQPELLDEALHEKADAIIERNTRTNPTCISCKQPITPEQPLLETIHGPYHDYPAKCQEGR